jgi:aminopeptidase YwaD
VALLLAVAQACNDGDGPEATESPTPTASSSPSPSPIPDPTPTETVNDQFDADRAFAIVEMLAGEIGIRFAGSAGEAEAAEFIRGELASYGYDATIQEFGFERALQYDTSLSIESPARSFAASALGGSPSGAVEAELVRAGIGRPNEFPAGTAGKIALMERGTLFFSEKVQNAAAAGAVAAVIYNDEPGPFLGSLDEDASIPVVSLPQQEGQELADLMAKGPMVAQLAVDVATAQGRSRNVIATPPDGKCTLIAGGHLDSVAAGPGANDNASGTAVVIEMARALAADGDFEDVCFVLFGAEEIGLIGSRHYVESLTDLERLTTRAMLNFDMLGVGNELPIGGSGSVLEVVADEAQALGINVRISGLPAGVGSDHASFIAADIPAVIINCFCDANYHTSQDLPVFVQPQRLGDAGELGLATIASLLASS